jgi:hypothetical protein
MGHCIGGEIISDKIFFFFLMPFFSSTLKSTKSPYIPYIGLHTKDLIYIYDGNPSFVGLSVNFCKFMMLWESVGIILKGVSAPYDTEKDKTVFIFSEFFLCSLKKSFSIFSDVPLFVGPTQFE